MIDWSEMRPIRKPTLKENAKYRRWVAYLKNSRLTLDEIHKRAGEYTERGMNPDDY
jgi:hypothetical protein